MLISDKTNFIVRKAIKNEEKYYVMIKRSVLQEDIKILNVYLPDSRASTCMRQNLIELQGEIDESIIIVGDFNPPALRNG